MTTLSRVRCAFACLGVLVLCLATAPWGIVAAHPGHDVGQPARYQLLPPGQDPSAPKEDDPPGSVLSPIEDRDGDGLPNVHDPDDDNGGTSDEDDPAPFDPVVEPTPEPDILSPIEDGDSDGIPNVQDPDDDNDGASDHDDPGPFTPGTDDPNPPPVTTTSPSGPVPTAPVIPSGGGATGAPVVTSLPVTGDGVSVPGHGTTLILGAMGFAGIGIALVSVSRGSRMRR